MHGRIKRPLPPEDLIVRLAELVVQHWHDHGPRHGFEAVLDDLAHALTAYRAQERAAQAEEERG